MAGKGLGPIKPPCDEKVILGHQSKSQPFYIASKRFTKMLISFRAIKEFARLSSEKLSLKANSPKQDKWIHSIRPACDNYRFPSLSVRLSNLNKLENKIVHLPQCDTQQTHFNCAQIWRLYESVLIALQLFHPLASKHPQSYCSGNSKASRKTLSSSCKTISVKIPIASRRCKLGYQPISASDLTQIIFVADNLSVISTLEIANFGFLIETLHWRCFNEKGDQFLCEVHSVNLLDLPVLKVLKD